MIRLRATRSASVALLALAIGAACGDRWEPTLPGFKVTGGPLATSESGTTATFQLALTTAPKAAVYVDVLTGDASEGLLIAPGGTVSAPWITLQFTPSDWSTAQTVTVKGVDDAIRDGDVAYTVRIVVAQSDDPDYAGAAPTSVQVVNQDDDTPAIVLSRTTLATAETGATSDSFEVVLASQPTGVVYIDVMSGDTTEGLLRGGTSGVTASGHIVLIFTPSNWSTPQSVTVIAQLDYTMDGEQTYAVTVGPASGDPEYAALAAQAVTVVNADTDVAGLVLSTRTLSLEESSSASFWVRLATIPAEPVLVPIVSGDTTEALVAAGLGSNASSVTLTFDSTNWNVYQGVRVDGVMDYTVDGTQSLVVTVGPPSGDPPYAALLAETIDVTVLNVDLASSEGTQATPVEVTGLLPYAGTVGTGSSWYRVTGFPDGALVAVRDAVDAVKLTVRDESLDHGTLCYAPGLYSSHLACAVRLPVGGSFLVQVEGSGSARGATFTLDVAPFTFSTDTPLSIPATGYQGATSAVSLSGVPAGYSAIAIWVDVEVTDPCGAMTYLYLTPPGGGDLIFYNQYLGVGGLDRTVFDESAPTYAWFEYAPPDFAGTFRPAQPFTHPSDANGTWTLAVLDDLDCGQPGTLVRWGIAAR